nr:MAG TPA: hypothetical protein [Caudoviricetes sp.]
MTESDLSGRQKTATMGYMFMSTKRLSHSSDRILAYSIPYPRWSQKVTQR